MPEVIDGRAKVPDWDLEQLEVILDEPANWQLVIAGPGSGKSAVACQRIAYLIDESVPPSRILMVSFTRTAVAELRDRIVSYAVAGVRARTVNIATIDSHAWSLRNFDAEVVPAAIANQGSYELSIEKTVDLFRSKQGDLLDFMSRLEHLIVDEAQDILGSRADLIIEILKSLSPSCGVTILADPAQAIYEFTRDGSDQTTQQIALLEKLHTDSPKPFTRRALSQIHRVKAGSSLVDLFLRTRKQIEEAGDPKNHIADVQRTIKEASGHDVGVRSYENMAEFLATTTDDSMLVLFRRRADVLFASSYCSNAGVEHRLRFSGSPVIIRPWLGWLLGESASPLLGRREFEGLWESRARLAPQPFAEIERESAWALLHRFAAAPRADFIDLVQLRIVLSRARPPIEFCFSEVGTGGPILGTIHASKGREADNVVLVMPSHSTKHDAEEATAVFEEGRVYYVGATRARRMLLTANNASARVAYLDSGRVFRRADKVRVQLEIGREGDVDRLASLSWSTTSHVQQTLASSVGKTLPARVWADPDAGYQLRIVLEVRGADGVIRPLEIGEMGKPFRNDLNRLWGLVDTERTLRPAPTIHHLYLIAVTTVALSDVERGAAVMPHSQSGFGLAPVLKGFPMIQFLYRKSRGH